jgi:flagellar assembly factor FliW
MNDWVSLMVSPFMLYSDYVFEIQHGETEGPILSFEEWKETYYKDENEED